MKRLAPILVLLLLAPACKETGWTFLQRSGGEADPALPAPVEPAPPDDGQDARDIIFVLGIDGMD